MDFLRLALRYLRSRRVAVVSVLTIAVGVMAMVVVTSLMDGVEDFLVAHLRGTQADYEVQAVFGRGERGQWEAVSAELAGELAPEGPIAGMAPRQEAWALVVPGEDPGVAVEERIQAAILIGVDYPRERRVIALDRFVGDVRDAALSVPAGRRDDPLAQRAEDARPWILLGDRLARNLGASRTGAGASEANLVTVLRGDPRKEASGRVELEERSLVFAVAGCFSTGMDDFDRVYAFIDRGILQGLLGTGAAADAQAVHVRLVEGADHAAGRALAARHPRLYFKSRDPEYELEVMAIREQKRIMLVILFFIIAVSSMAILGVVHMMVVEKVRDIGILRSMGMSRPRVVATFSAYGACLAAIGAVLGAILGLQATAHLDGIVRWLSDIFGIDLFSAEIYRFERIPTRVTPLSVAAIMGSALVLSLVASLLPAVKAGRMHPVQALRSE